MAAYSVSVPAELPSAALPYRRRAVAAVVSPVASRRANKAPLPPRLEPACKPQPAELPELDLIWGSLLESLPKGVIVVSRYLQPIYWNHKAKQLCQDLAEGRSIALPELPTAISEACHRLLRNTRQLYTPLVMECQVGGAQTVRISTRWLFPTSGGRSGTKVMEPDLPIAGEANGQASHILIFVENCTETLREELRIEQKKYDLTEREAEVWMLLRQEFTYQEIAKMLQISLNTVKTHVKNVYAKKRSCQGREQFWCSE